MVEHLASTNTNFPMQLHSFNQLLFDQLMPWLPENNSDLFYRAWRQNMSTGSKMPYLHQLIKVYERNNRALNRNLVHEWQIIGNWTLTGLMHKIYSSLKSQELSSLKLFFYRDLIVEAFAHSYNYSVMQLNSLSAFRRQFELRRLMRRLDDLLQRSRMIYKNQEGEDAVIVYLVHLCVLIFRQLLRKTYPTLLSPDDILLNNNLLKPNSHSDYPQGHLLITFYHWYEAELPKIIDQFASTGGLTLVLNTKIDYMQEQIATVMESIKNMQYADEAPKKSIREYGETTINTVIAESNPLISTAEAAKLLGISESGLLKQAKRGAIPYIKIGKLYKYDRQQIKVFIKNNN